VEEVTEVRPAEPAFVVAATPAAPRLQREEWAEVPPFVLAPRLRRSMGNLFLKVERRVRIGDISS